MASKGLVVDKLLVVGGTAVDDANAIPVHENASARRDLAGHAMVLGRGENLRRQRHAAGWEMHEARRGVM